MDAAHNPFAPGAGTQPPELTGRDTDQERARILLERMKIGRHVERSIIFTGLRGVGKTVLLNRIEQIATNTGCCTVFIESPEERPLAELLVPHLRQALIKISRAEGAKEKIGNAIGALRRFASVFQVRVGEIEFSVKDMAGVADSGVLDQDLPDLFVAIGEAAQESKTAIAIFIDELQYVDEKELAALIAGIHKVGQKNLPLVFFGAGLPQLAGLMGQAKSYAERLFEFRTIGPLSKEDSHRAIREPIDSEGQAINADALEEIFNQAEGYPYFLQEWGSHAWNSAVMSPISLVDVQNATQAAIKTLDEGFFRVRFERLTKSEKEYLRAMAEIGPGPHKSGDIAAKLGKSPQTVAPVRSNIIHKGMIFAPIYGDTAFTVPKFHEYMKRVMPEFVVTPSRSRTRRT